MKKHLSTEYSRRQYMLSKDFEIYYYSQNKSSVVEAHTHDYYEFYFFLEGDVSIVVEDIPYTMKPGHILFVPPKASHYLIPLNPEKPYRRFVLWISNHYYQHLKASSMDYAYFIHHVQTTKNHIIHMESLLFNSFQSMLFDLIEETKGNRFGKDTEIFLRLNSILLSLNRVVYEQHHQENTYWDKNLYHNLCFYIENHLEENLSLDMLAGEFFVSKFYISHIFKDMSGISVHQYITKKRLQACKNAILNFESITTLYQHYGFNDYSNFYRAFKKEYGISPKEYRELLHKE